jgi:4-diphosphocytidyl-2-C-methyl-D-erythritol kinase
VIALHAHAKLNLYLRVVGRRPDGYHAIETILHCIDVADDLEVVGDSTGVITLETDHDLEPNVVVVAAERLAARMGTGDGASIRLTKRIPVGAGLGGGSADAAATLVALNDLWDADLDRTALMEVAADVGSDVPYFLIGGTALATGRGEKVSALDAPKPMSFVLGLSDEPLMTADVYDHFDELPPEDGPSPAQMIAALRGGDVAAIGSLVSNDLARAAVDLRPELAAKKAVLAGAGALGVCVSGSGPTVFAVATDATHAASIATAVAGDFDRVLVVRSKDRSIERPE